MGHAYLNTKREVSYQKWLLLCNWCGCIYVWRLHIFICARVHLNMIRKGLYSYIGCLGPLMIFFLEIISKSWNGKALWFIRYWVYNLILFALLHSICFCYYLLVTTVLVLKMYLKYQRVGYFYYKFSVTRKQKNHCEYMK